MTKTTNNSSIAISKLAFLDEMLPEPSLQYDYNEWTEKSELTGLKNLDKLMELVKKIAAKSLTEEELVNILGDKSHDCMHNRSTYTPNSKEFTN